MHTSNLIAEAIEDEKYLNMGEGEIMHNSANKKEVLQKLDRKVKALKRVNGKISKELDENKNNSSVRYAWG